MRSQALQGPLVIDTYELGRRPGSERTVSKTAAAPADLGIDVLGVREGSDIALELRLEAVMEGVLATGTVSTALSGECVRCLEQLDEELVVDIQELYLYDDGGAEFAEDESHLEGDLLNLEPVLRDAIVLALPQNPLCGPECPGLCSECGARLADDPDHTHGDVIDPRWAALNQLSTDRPESDGQQAIDRTTE
ncbi:MAG: DUF177 domain-containing protein [Propionibacteriales bacterium]|nr:DUF177 domain-containing protein [Propionibacteriales bacterium]